MRLSHGGRQVASHHFRISRYLRLDAPASMQAVAEVFERRFSLTFDSITHVPKETLRELHGYGLPSFRDRKTIDIASAHDPSILSEMLTLTKIANKAELSTADRQVYFQALLAVYGKMGIKPTSVPLDDSHTLFVGIEREGRILAESLGWLPTAQSIRPHAKRMWTEDGLLIGFSGLEGLREFRRCIVIDGAIASGSTLIALIEQLVQLVGSFEVYSAHATDEGLGGLLAYAETAGVELRITVGHSTPGLSTHYYAVLPDAGGEVLAVGDLGDMIGSLCT